MLVIGIFLTLGTVLSTSDNYVNAADDEDIVYPLSPRPY